MPAWLDELTPEAVDAGQIPVDDLLADSVYYPAAGTDGSPVRLLGCKWKDLIDGGPATSYVYADFNVPLNVHIGAVCYPGFNGYLPLGFNGRIPPRYRRYEPNAAVVRIPLETLQIAEPHGRPPWAEDFDLAWPAPFAAWSVFQRQPDFGDDHGPPRFSLLYIGGEALATYQALYAARGLQPRVLALIQQGWPRYLELRDPEGAFAQAVLQAGPPRYLLGGGSAVRFDEDARPRRTVYWPQYGTRHRIVSEGTFQRGLWELGP